MRRASVSRKRIRRTNLHTSNIDCQSREGGSEARVCLICCCLLRVCDGCHRRRLHLLIATRSGFERCITLVFIYVGVYVYAYITREYLFILSRTCIRVPIESPCGAITHERAVFLAAAAAARRGKFIIFPLFHA